MILCAGGVLSAAAGVLPGTGGRAAVAGLVEISAPPVAHPSPAAYLTLRPPAAAAADAWAPSAGSPAGLAAAVPGEIGLLAQSPEDLRQALPAFVDAAPEAPGMPSGWTMRIEERDGAPGDLPSMSWEAPPLAPDQPEILAAPGAWSGEKAVVLPRQSPAVSVTVREASPTVHEVGNPATPLRPLFRLLCDACPAVNNALNYLHHRPLDPHPPYSFSEAVIVNLLHMGEMAVTGGGMLNLAEWNF